MIKINIPLSDSNFKILYDASACIYVALHSALNPTLHITVHIALHVTRPTCKRTPNLHRDDRERQSARELLLPCFP